MTECVFGSVSDLDIGARGRSESFKGDSGKSCVGFNMLTAIWIVGCTMRKSENGRPIHRLARNAVDEDALAEILELASDEECNREAVDALRAIIVDEIVDLAFASTWYARRRGRHPTGDDVAEVKESRCECVPQTYAMMLSADPDYSKIESV